MTGDIAALAVRCGRSTIEQLEGASVDLGEASDMLGHAMAALRGHFAAALATTAHVHSFDRRQSRQAGQRDEPHRRSDRDGMTQDPHEPEATDER